jgi:putative ABC transport system substrate-binding protein
MRLQAGISIAAYAPVPGVLMGYGPDLAANSGTAAGMVDQILRGADPATMPILNSEYSLMVNMVVAESLGIDIPRGILRQAGLIMRNTDEPEATDAATEEVDEASDD